MKATLQFLGAAQTVTGSKFLLEVNRRRVLIECGLFQGLKKLRKRNWNPLPVPPSSVDAVILTHAHLDHSGYLPRLVERGFRGKVFCTPATRDLLHILLPDSGHLQEEQARFANKKGFSRHKPALPLYTRKEAVASLRRIKTLGYGRELEVTKGVTVRFHPSGHILGAAFVELCFAGKRLVISGDLGGYDGYVMRPPAPIPENVQYIAVESTYGGRVEQHRPIQDQFREQIAPVLKRKGTVILPAFAVGRTTLVLYHLRALQGRGELPDVPVYVDSPMATDAVEIYRRYPHEHNLRPDWLKSPGVRGIRSSRPILIRSVQKSKELNTRPGPSIIISASGMATGGRVLHHLKHRLPHRRNLVLLVGYQAIGTRGRALLDGASKIKIHGELVPVRARVASVRGLSAHGDGDEILQWLRTARTKPRRVFLIHGEPEAIRATGERVRQSLRFRTQAPKYLQKVTM